MNFLIKCLKGIPIGIANIIPGVSGATLAIVMGIFDELIETINSVVKNFFGGKWKEFAKNLKFLIPIAIGMLVGIFAFSKLLNYCLETYPMPTVYFFVGLIVGGLPLIISAAKKEKVEWKHWILFVIAFAIVIGMSLLQGIDAEANAASSVNFIEMIKLFFGGVIAASAMVVPGISGSFVLLLLGQYDMAIEAVSNMNFAVIIPIGLGAVVGIILIAKLIEVLLKKFYSYTYMAIIGLIVASIITLTWDAGLYAGIGVVSVIASVISFAGGVAVSMILGKE